MEQYKNYQSPLNSSMQDLIKSNNAWIKQLQNPFNSSIQNLIESNRSWLKEFHSPINSSIQSLVESNSTWLKQYHNPINSSLQSLLESNNAWLKQYQNPFNSNLSHQLGFDNLKKQADFLGKFFSDQDHYQKYFNASGRITVDKDFIEKIQELSEAVPSGIKLDTAHEIGDFNRLIPTYLEINGSETLTNYLKTIPEKTRVIFLWVLYRVLFLYCFLLIQDISVGVVSDRVKPAVSEFVFGKPTASNKEISKLSRNMADVQFETIRFVSIQGQGLNVRLTPNSQGPIIDILPRSEVVTLISKSEDLSWSQIRYKNQDNQVMQGWVFSRYLKKFELN